MPTLLINVVNGSWTVQVANTGVSYTFSGATLDAQAVSVQGFAETMAEGNADVGFFLEAWDVPEEQLAQQLFGTTDMITYVGDIIYGSVGEEFIIDDLEVAGEALLAAL